MSEKIRPILIFILIAFIFGSGLAAGYFFDRQITAAFGQTTTTGISPNFDLLREAWQVIRENYVNLEALEPKDLTYGAINGMVRALGDVGHTTFLTPEEVRQQQNFVQGELEGIGAHVEMRDGRPTIVAPIEGSPADRAGLEPGDVILEVNGEDTAGLSLNQVVQKVLGPAGTEVTLTIRDAETGETRQVTITRAVIELERVSWEMIPGTDIAMVRVQAFSSDVSEELRQALMKAQEQNASGLILDLRNNPGGLLNEAVNVASQFLTRGNVLLVRDAQGNITEFEDKSGAVAPDIPLVVLVNQGSASASEIVAGALQDHERATLVGQTTFGTGTVLREFELSDGSALLLATEEWLTPEGRVIWHQGITPDVEVALPEGVSPVNLMELQNMTPDEFNSIQDQQLMRGIEILQQ